MPPLVFLLALLAAATAALAVVLLAIKVRQHRALLDERVDTLADASHVRGARADERFDELERRLRPLERRRRVDHLLALAGVAERSGRLGRDAAGRLETALLQLHDEALEDAGIEVSNSGASDA